MLVHIKTGLDLCSPYWLKEADRLESMESGKTMMMLKNKQKNKVRKAWAKKRNTRVAE